MKKFLVIGNPIEHSLSPQLHNYWFKQNNINAKYDKKKINENDIEGLISEIKEENITGINVTLPFKKIVIPFLDDLTPIAKQAQAVNTIFKIKNKIFGDNTDIGGFENGMKYINYNMKNKIVFILGAGGVALSIILALKRLGAYKIIISNRTKKQPEELKKNFNDIEIIEWGETPDFDVIINATSLGLKNNDKIKLNYKKNTSDKLFYDVIYNPKKTNFLLDGEKMNYQTENGKMMFIYQAQLSFKTWHKVQPKIDGNTIRLLD
jgi:shikimate dehydrogenase|tara:strand:+ start:1240 stop:2031 length:792 start_codon:yes stop_codon:yes gene_type:complete